MYYVSQLYAYMEFYQSYKSVLFSIVLDYKPVK